jgi:hypothetical protein
VNRKKGPRKGKRHNHPDMLGEPKKKKKKKKKATKADTYNQAPNKRAN